MGSETNSNIMQRIPWVPVTLTVIILGWVWTLQTQVGALTGKVEYVEKTRFTRQQGLDLDREIIHLQARLLSQKEFNNRVIQALDRLNMKHDNSHMRGDPPRGAE